MVRRLVLLSDSVVVELEAIATVDGCVAAATEAEDVDALESGIFSIEAVVFLLTLARVTGALGALIGAEVVVDVEVLLVFLLVATFFRDDIADTHEIVVLLYDLYRAVQARVE